MPAKNYSNRYSAKRTSKRRKGVINLIVFLIILSSLFFFGKFFLERGDIKDFSSTFIEKPKQIDLSVQINEVLVRYPEITAGVALAPYDREEIQAFGSQESYTAASTTKVLTAVYYYHLVESGKVGLNDYLVSNKASWHLKQMINQSNNDSWHLLNTKVGYQNLQDYGRSIGLASYKWNGNTITAGDYAFLLKKLLQGELINNTNRSLLYIYMQNTNREDLIVPNVPENLTLYHKYGLLDGNLHDIAIITDGEKTISLVIYTDIKTFVPLEKRTQFFADITRLVISGYFS